jgi:hypothetical protein
LQVLKDSNHSLHRSQTEFVSLTTSSLSGAPNRATARVNWLKFFLK